MKKMLQIENLQVKYSENIVLNEFNLTLQTGLIHGILGRNGSGKTTFFNTLFGIKKFAKGKILFENSPILKSKIAFLESENYFYPDITGKEYLDLFVNKNVDMKKWNQIFELPLNNLIENYSTGMKKKLALLGMLKLDKPIMILDEPFNGLDLDSTYALKIILKKLKEKGKTLLISSHILEILTNICDFLHLLENGKIKFSKNYSEFFNIEKEIFATFDKEKLINDLML